MSPLQTQPSMVCREGEEPLHVIHGAADVDEADISTPVALDQRAANCLEEAVRSFTAMRSKQVSIVTR
ncbi:hypothetical protein TNCV_3221561 [Trichonephila clavipes]|nr:hypothetical protein TNCV_3221561 [Trichonephila clavipes]